MATTQTKPNPTKVITGLVRLSYVNVFKPRKDEESGRESYSVMALIPKSDTATVAKINAAVDAVKNDPASQQVWGSKFLASFKTPLRDGDTERDTEESPEYAGHWFINVNSGTKPGVVDAHVQPVMDESAVYSGCYGKVSLNMYAYKQKGGVGIAAGLNNVQKIKDGERLGGGRSNPEDDFSVESEEGEGSFMD